MKHSRMENVYVPTTTTQMIQRNKNSIDLTSERIWQNVKDNL